MKKSNDMRRVIRRVMVFVPFCLLTLLPLFSGCGAADDDVTVEHIPEGTAARPDWPVPNYDRFEQTMAVNVVLQDTLQRYASVADLMCATIGSEVRGVATPQHTGGQWLFPLIVASNEAGVSISLSYYCDRLHRIFTVDWAVFDAATVPLGTGGIYQPLFIK